MILSCITGFYTSNSLQATKCSTWWIQFQFISIKVLKRKLPWAHHFSNPLSLIFILLLAQYHIMYKLEWCSLLCKTWQSLLLVNFFKPCLILSNALEAVSTAWLAHMSSSLDQNKGKVQVELNHPAINKGKAEINEMSLNFEAAKEFANNDWG